MARVLVVDDEFDIRQAVSEALVDEGYDVVAAADGAEALRQLRVYHPHVVLLDLMMPGMNGWEFRRAQQDDPDPAVSDIPVVVLSASGRVGSIQAEAFLQKPFELDDLLAQVKRWASSTPPAGPNSPQATL